MAGSSGPFGNLLTSGGEWARRSQSVQLQGWPPHRVRSLARGPQRQARVFIHVTASNVRVHVRLRFSLSTEKATKESMEVPLQTFLSSSSLVSFCVLVLVLT